MLPNPGSDEALAMGCTCPRLDNHCGRGLYTFDGETFFVYVENCPVHDEQYRAVAEG